MMMENTDLDVLNAIVKADHVKAILGNITMHWRNGMPSFIH